jgi:hypothetical protein
MLLDSAARRRPGLRWLPRRPESHEAEDKERDGPEASGEPAWTEVDASLRPLARALLALAEQLSREE